MSLKFICESSHVSKYFWQYSVSVRCLFTQYSCCFRSFDSHLSFANISRWIEFKYVVLRISTVPLATLCVCVYFCVCRFLRFSVSCLSSRGVRNRLNISCVWKTSNTTTKMMMIGPFYVKSQPLHCLISKKFLDFAVTFAFTSSIWIVHDTL